MAGVLKSERGIEGTRKENVVLLRGPKFLLLRRSIEKPLRSIQQWFRHFSCAILRLWLCSLVVEKDLIDDVERIRYRR
jgi:hypothetical protein